MSNLTVVGGQWGDEGKGKIVDLLADRYGIVARWAGGPNAGHTVRFASKTFALHHIPTGILRDGVTAVIGNGTVIDPASLLQEIDELERQGIKVGGRLRVSHRAHVILPFHKSLDQWAEENTAGLTIGTTRRGIGPAYMSKAARLGVRMVELGDIETLQARIRAFVDVGFGGMLQQLNQPIFVPEMLAEEYFAHGVALAPYVCDTAVWLADQVRRGTRVLFEGAQGTMLDVDHGTYPFVTSSSAVAGGLAPGCGVGPHAAGSVIGVFKAYGTRVGAGPMPTEQINPSGERLRERGREYGTTTGRPRRCGWFDGVAARYAAAVSGFDAIAVTLLDVLDDFDEIPVCTGYRYRDIALSEMPAEPWILDEIEPVYEALPGWKKATGGARRLSDLPANARRYLDRLSELTGCDVVIVSVGPDREQTIWVSDRLWADNPKMPALTLEL